ncbi:hypothetical protein XYCOK13_41440 [Xylanibacillus composti]|uniref:DUF2508 family protein n=1 Tax=Xylanibacillus composti TaxID=1572762 RepID=A0A8J4H7K2_9BACL|nr:DUF2508 family protein [Xylanibacillus composti]GIQ71320.1 hypothetical protein XYCOK13_41440 [Xylanibacillus composti]
MGLRNLWRWLPGQAASQEPERRQPVSQDMALYREIKDAEHNWRVAEQRMNEAVDKDQIDYAIYTLEAAEKRYEMLIRQAKQRKLRIGFAEWAQYLEEERIRKGGTG